MRHAALSCSAFLILTVSGFAAEPTARHQITIDDFFTLATIGEAAISPDGNSIAYVESRWQQSTDDRKAEIWLVAADGSAPTRLTFERADYAQLKWAPDAKFLYFTCRKHRGSKDPPAGNAQRQVWRISPAGGEPIPVTSLPEGIEHYDLLGSGEAIVYTTSRREVADPFRELRKQFSAVRYSDAKTVHTSLWMLDLQSWRSERLVEIGGAVDELAVAPSGSRVAMITSSDGTVTALEGQSQVTIFDVQNSQLSKLEDQLWRKQAPSPYGRLHSPTWSAAGDALAVSCCFDAYPSEVYVAYWKGDEPQLGKLPRPGDVSLNGGVETPPRLVWRGESHDLCWLGQDHGRLRIYLTRNATTAPAVDAQPLTPGDVAVEWFSLDRSGNRVAAVMADPQRMADIHLYQDGQLRQLTKVNAHTADWKLPRVSIFRWKGARGDTVEGILELPPDYQPGQKLPTIVNLHGGPTSAILYRQLYGYLGSVLYAAQGYAYLSPNYHGSTGYGDKFMVDLVGQYNDIEVEDIVKGVEALVAAGIADRERLGVSGWSNGGYLTNCLIAKTRLFKAASSGAGFVDTVQEWGTNDEPAYPVMFFGGLPWQVPEVYRRTSPLFEFGNVRTPTIFHVGENDLRCPKGNSEMAYRAIKLYSDVPTELLVYPGEPHGLGRYKSRQAKMTWDLAWFDKYLKSKGQPAAAQERAKH